MSDKNSYAVIFFQFKENDFYRQNLKSRRSRQSKSGKNAQKSACHCQLKYRGVLKCEEKIGFLSSIAAAPTVRQAQFQVRLTENYRHFDFFGGERGVGLN